MALSTIRKWSRNGTASSILGRHVSYRGGAFDVGYHIGQKFVRQCFKLHVRYRATIHKPASI